MQTIPALSKIQQPPVLPDYAATDTSLKDAAQKMEATFLAEMLKSAGVGTPRETFGGGAGEDQFASFLREEYAQAITEAGGVGLAEALFNAMKARINE